MSTKSHKNTFVKWWWVHFKNDVSKKTTLQDVERFRMRYARHYKLRNFALMLVTKVKIGSFIVSFVKPGLYVRLLGQNVPKDILQEFSVTKLEIQGSSEH